MCRLLCPLSSQISTLQTPYLRSVQPFASFFCIWAARHNSGKSTKPNPSGTRYYLIVYGTYLLSSFSCSRKNYSKTFPLLPSTAPASVLSAGALPACLLEKVEPVDRYPTMLLSPSTSSSLPTCILTFFHPVLVQDLSLLLFKTGPPAWV